jgi:hypothetical protein
MGGGSQELFIIFACEHPMNKVDEVLKKGQLQGGAAACRAVPAPSRTLSRCAHATILARKKTCSTVLVFEQQGLSMQRKRDQT